MIRGSFCQYRTNQQEKAQATHQAQAANLQLNWQCSRDAHGQAVVGLGPVLLQHTEKRNTAPTLSLNSTMGHTGEAGRGQLAR